MEQLNLILEVVGTPSEETLVSIGSEKVGEAGYEIEIIETDEPGLRVHAHIASLRPRRLEHGLTQR